MGRPADGRSGLRRAFTRGYVKRDRTHADAFRLAGETDRATSSVWVWASLKWFYEAETGLSHGAAQSTQSTARDDMVTARLHGAGERNRETRCGSTVRDSQVRSVCTQG